MADIRNRDRRHNNSSSNNTQHNKSSHTHNNYKAAVPLPTSQYHKTTAVSSEDSESDSSSSSSSSTNSSNSDSESDSSVSSRSRSPPGSISSKSSSFNHMSGVSDNADADERSHLLFKNDCDLLADEEQLDNNATVEIVLS